MRADSELAVSSNSSLGHYHGTCLAISLCWDKIHTEFGYASTCIEHNYLLTYICPKNDTISTLKAVTGGIVTGSAKGPPPVLLPICTVPQGCLAVMKNKNI